MNVTSLELCKELYKLSGWDNTDFAWDVSDRSDLPFENVVPSDSVIFIYYPAYDLGYLLRRLGNVQTDHPVNIYGDEARWSARWLNPDDNGMHYIEAAKTPENAAAKLAIELFKQGILKKETK